MEIVIYRRQRVDYGEQSDTTCLVPEFACCVAGPSEFFIQRFSIERSRTASPSAVLQRATGWPRQAPGVWDRFVSYTRLYETSAGCVRSICLVHPCVRDKRRVSEIDLSRAPGFTRQAPGVWDRFIPAYEWYSFFFGDATMGQWRHN